MQIRDQKRVCLLWTILPEERVCFVCLFSVFDRRTCPVAVIAVSVRPWKEFTAVMMTGKSMLSLV